MGEKKVGATPETRRGPRMTRRDVRVSCALAILLLLALARAAAAWGPEGHVIVTRAALAASDGLPPWFRDAGDALAELSNGPDRWREAEEAARALGGVPGAVHALLGDSLAQVPRLYRLGRESRRTHDDADARALVRERLAAGATLLARLWRTAWVRSGG